MTNLIMVSNKNMIRHKKAKQPPVAMMNAVDRYAEIGRWCGIYRRIGKVLLSLNAIIYFFFLEKKRRILLITLSLAPNLPLISV